MFEANADKEDEINNLEQEDNIDDVDVEEFMAKEEELKM